LSCRVKQLSVEVTEYWSCDKVVLRPERARGASCEADALRMQVDVYETKMKKDNTKKCKDQVGGRMARMGHAPTRMICC
jgi:hypothetical protein